MASADVDLTGRSYVQDPSAPDPIPPHPGDVVNPQGRDGLDDLLDYDPQTDNIFGDVGPNNTTAPADGTTVNLDANQGNGDDGGRGLGIDEEVKVRKPRPPVAKLDETRLLSEKGIPRLRRISKDRLRFKGKGHEFTDVARMLNFYQLWLDDLFPKAKFADGLALIEKLGHTKRMQMMRKEWIDEEKPKPVDAEPDSEPEPEHMDETGGDLFGERQERSGDATVKDQGQNAQTDTELYDMDDELYRDPTPAAEVPMPSVEQPATIEENPEEDELDWLLAEDAAGHPGHANQDTSRGNVEDDFADDEEAMMDAW